MSGADVWFPSPQPGTVQTYKTMDMGPVCRTVYLFSVYLRAYTGTKLYVLFDNRGKFA